MLQENPFGLVILSRIFLKAENFMMSLVYKGGVGGTTMCSE